MSYNTSRLDCWFPMAIRSRCPRQSPGCCKMDHCALVCWKKGASRCLRGDRSVLTPMSSDSAISWQCRNRYETDMEAKIVFVNRYFFPDQSATSRMLSDLAFRLQRAGLAVEIVTSRQLYSDPDANLPKREISDDIVIHR